MEIKMIVAAPFFHVFKQEGVELFSASLNNVEKILKPKQYTDPAIKLPPKFHKSFELFFHQKANKLPPHKPYDYKIKFIENRQPKYGFWYSMSQKKFKFWKNSSTKILSEPVFCYDLGLDKERLRRDVCQIWLGSLGKRFGTFRTFRTLDVARPERLRRPWRPTSYIYVAVSQINNFSF